ncbi:hypothetical protein GCM10020256_02200 [Streptomyces thermocoprophilus]
MRTVLRSALLRMVLVWASAASVIVTLLSYTAVFVLGGDGGATVGLVLSASGAAGLVGALLAPGLVTRLGARRAVVSATWSLLVPAGVLVAADSAGSFAAGFALLALLLPTVTVVLSGAMVRAVPREVQSQAGGGGGRDGRSGGGRLPGAGGGAGDLARCPFAGRAVPGVAGAAGRVHAGRVGAVAHRGGRGGRRARGPGRAQGRGRSRC